MKTTEARAREKEVKSEKHEKSTANEIEIPPELKGLALYERDEKLCRQWPELFPAWKAAFPGVSVVAEVRKAHAWEVANPERRKVRRAAFLQRWLERAQDRGYRGPGGPPARPGRMDPQRDADPDPGYSRPANRRPEGGVPAEPSEIGEIVKNWKRQHGKE